MESIVWGFFYYLKEKEEKKITYGSDYSVKTSKGILLFFLTWMVLCLLGMIGAVILVLVIEEPNETQIFWILETVAFVFFLFGLLGFVSEKYNYLVVKEEGIYVKKILKKDKLIRYSDITYINSHTYGFGQVACYDSNGIPLFEVASYHVGTEQLYSTLHNKGYLLLPNPYPSEDMKKNTRFQHYKKISSAKVRMWCCLLFGIGFGLLGILITFNLIERYIPMGIGFILEIFALIYYIKTKKLRVD